MLLCHLGFLLQSPPFHLVHILLRQNSRALTYAPGDAYISALLHTSEQDYDKGKVMYRIAHHLAVMCAGGTHSYIFVWYLFSMPFAFCSPLLEVHLFTLFMFLLSIQSRDNPARAARFIPVRACVRAQVRGSRVYVRTYIHAHIPGAAPTFQVRCCQAAVLGGVHIYTYTVRLPARANMFNTVNSLRPNFFYCHLKKDVSGTYITERTFTYIIRIYPMGIYKNGAIYRCTSISLC